MAYVVANFDPIRFKEIYNSCSHEEISEAYRTKIAYESYEPSK